MSEVKRYNRKRKKSFLKNAKKYGKRGYYGRGSQLDADVYQYFVNILETYRKGFDSEEDKLIFVNNVFNQTVDQEVNCSCNQVGCRVIEMLLPFANDDTLQRFIKIFGADLRPLCSDRFASHIVEALVNEASNRYMRDVSYNDYKDFVVKVSKFLLNNLEDYIWDTYGNHVIRTCLENIAKLPKTDDKINTVGEICDIPEEYLEIIKDYAERLIVWPQFVELCNLELTSGFLQLLLKCIRKIDVKLLKKYLKKLIGEVFISEGETQVNVMHKVFFSKSLLMLLETAIQVAPQKEYLKIYTNLFADNIPKLAKTRSSNFAVQKLLQCCNEKELFENMFNELIDHFDEILTAGHSGILMALSQSCRRLGSKQGAFVQALMKALHCLEPEERRNSFILCLSRLDTFENNEAISNENLQKERLNLHGTLILQELLNYNKPILIVNGILSLEAEVLQNLFSNTMGSHIVDSFVKGSFVGEKSREKLVRRMMGTFQMLASSKYGSRSFEALWNAANFKCKNQIMEELSVKSGTWSNSEYGRIIAGKINLVLFKRNKEQWKNSLNQIDKSEKILADILK